MEQELPTPEQLSALREENEHLRRAAAAFGELAERLMSELAAERRRVARMRVAPSPRVQRQRAEPVGSR